ncbi:phosphopantetheine-binding protein [Kitasatospora sp. NPDC059463]|uniref:phosphopantetheine-binding protein n=1 Tax=unclassified Kitasatospora TaxID=2633591 RepID=UPI0036B85C91
MSDSDGLAELISVAGTELGLPLGPEYAEVDFDDLPGWDSLHLLVLLTTLERSSGRRLSLPDLLQARTLADIHRIVTV